MITQHDLKHRIDYDPDTGIITERFYTSFVDDVPDPIKMDDNYIRIAGTSYTLNKIIWLYMTGEIAKGRIYTLNGDARDKRWKNITRNYHRSSEAPGKMDYPPECRRTKPQPTTEKLTQNILKEELRYDPNTGEFSRVCYSSDEINRDIFNNRVGLLINIGGNNYSARQIAWLYMTGEIYAGKLYMVDGDNRNLKWGNITTDQAESKRKLMKTHRRNKSGCVGVTWLEREERWLSQITVNGKRKYLGTFKDKADAIAARKIAEIT